MGVVVVALVLWAAFLTDYRPAAVRMGGLALQLLGVLTVAWGVHRTRQIFGRPGLTKVIKSWLQRFPRFKPKSVSGAGSFAASASITASGCAQSVAPEGASVEKRLSVVEDNVKRLTTRVDEMHASTKRSSESDAQALDRERGAGRPQTERGRSSWKPPTLAASESLRWACCGCQSA